MIPQVHLFPFVFWKKLKTPKRDFKITFFFSFRVTTPRGPTPENGGIFYQGGCRVHGTSIILPDEESSKLLGATSNGHLGPNGGHRGHQPDNGPVGTRRRSPHSASVSSSPLASPIPPLGPAPPYDHSNCSDRMHKSCACVSFIAEHTKAREEATKVRYFFITKLSISKGQLISECPLDVSNFPKIPPKI